MARMTGGERRRRIVENAAVLLRRKGYSSTSISGVLEASGISRGTFYFHFRSKRALGEAVLSYYEEDLPRLFTESFEGRSWAAGVSEVMDYFLGPCREAEHLGLPLANLGLEFANREPALHRRVADLLRIVERELAARLRERGVPEREAEGRAASVLALFEGHQLRYLVYGLEGVRQQMKRHLSALGEAAPDLPRALVGAAPQAASQPAEKSWNSSGGNGVDNIDGRSIINSVAADPAGEKEGQRSEMVSCVASLFWQKGYELTTLRDIVEFCGVPKGSFNYYFGSKRRLAADVLEFHRGECERLVGEALDAPDWPAAARRLAERAAGGGSSHVLEWPLTNMGLEFANTDEVMGGLVSEILSAMEGRFERALAAAGLEGPALAEAAGYALAVWQGHLVRMRIYEDTRVADKIREDLEGLVK